VIAFSIKEVSKAGLLSLCTQVWVILVAFCALVGSVPVLGQDDIVIADFEADNYGDWTVQGEAFGTKPAQGTLPNQMAVEGFLGKGLVNSFVGGDDSIGKLTSPSFKIQRPYINFLVGGGKYPEDMGVRLLVDGSIVRSTTGPNDVAGGSERLGWASWDVTEFKGKQAVIEIVDNRKGGWGHINVDHIVQSDKHFLPKPSLRELVISKPYLHLPVKNSGPMVTLHFMIGDTKVRQLDIGLTDGKPDLWVFIDTRKWLGKKLTIDAGPQLDGPKILEGIAQSDELPSAESVYQEKFRPQFHFTSRVGWLNDPNGLVYQNGTWHLFYQHNPVGWNWGNMHWGHATSKDLFHWQENDDVFRPWIETKGMCFSGSALIDQKNTSGFQTGANPPLVAALTDTGAGEVIAFSNDEGANWTMYDKNPVVKHQGRDPKIVWHELTKKWIMAVYDELEGKQWIAFYSSPNLKDWTFESRIVGYFECPDLFPIKVRGKAHEECWILYAADGKYAIGDFDGHQFTPRHEGKHQVWYGNFYAAQTYSDAPDNRRVQIGWGNGIVFPGMPFNQQMVVPVELTMRETSSGIRMFAEPVKELENLRSRTARVADMKIIDQPLKLDFSAELMDLEFVLEPGAENLVTRVRGQEIIYEPKSAQIRFLDVSVPVALNDGKFKMRVLVDRGSIEIFVNDGQVAISKGVLVDQGNKSVEIQSNSPAKLVSAAMHELKSAWSKQ
jgi:fructan beta-fructosidase